MKRREFIWGTVGALATRSGRSSATAARRIYTVTGPVAAAELGITLMHEHVLVDFIGADTITPGRYDVEEVVKAALPPLREVAGLGCRTFVECTPAYLGRDPRLLQRLARDTGLGIITNTGYYGAGAGKFVPAHARMQTAGQIAARWIAEHEQGIEGTGIRPGLLKTAVSQAPLSELDAKLIRAAALTHKATGLVIASHTGTGSAAMEQLEILDKERAPAKAFIWVHAQNEEDTSFHLRAAERGAWVEFESARASTLSRILDLVFFMASHKLLGSVLISGDSGWYHVGEPGGGDYRPYDLLFTRAVPAIRERLGEKAVRQLLVENPARALGG